MAYFGGSEPVFGPISAHFEASQAKFGPFQPVLAGPSMDLDHFRPVLGPSQVKFGPFWSKLEGPSLDLDHFWPILDHFWPDLGTRRSNLGLFGLFWGVQAWILAYYGWPKPGFGPFSACFGDSQVKFGPLPYSGRSKSVFWTIFGLFWDLLA